MDYAQWRLRREATRSHAAPPRTAWPPLLAAMTRCYDRMTCAADHRSEASTPDLAVPVLDPPLYGRHRSRPGIQVGEAHDALVVSSSTTAGSCSQVNLCQTQNKFILSVIYFWPHELNALCIRFPRSRVAGTFNPTRIVLPTVNQLASSPNQSMCACHITPD